MVPPPPQAPVAGTRAPCPRLRLPLYCRAGRLHQVSPNPWRPTPHPSHLTSNPLPIPLTPDPDLTPDLPSGDPLTAQWLHACQPAARRSGNQPLLKALPCQVGAWQVS